MLVDCQGGETCFSRNELGFWVNFGMIFSFRAYLEPAPPSAVSITLQVFEVFGVVVRFPSNGTVSNLIEAVEERS